MLIELTPPLLLSRKFSASISSIINEKVELIELTPPLLLSRKFSASISSIINEK